MLRRWAVFELVGANPITKSELLSQKLERNCFLMNADMYQWYQIMICLLKFDFFFFGSVTMQVRAVVIKPVIPLAYFLSADHLSPCVELCRIRTDHRGYSNRSASVGRCRNCGATGNKMVKSFQIQAHRKIYICVESSRLMSISLVIMLAAETYCAYYRKIFSCVSLMYFIKLVSRNLASTY